MASTLINTPGPTDHFTNRRPVGREALVLAGNIGFTDGVSQGDPATWIARLRAGGSPPELQTVDLSSFPKSAPADFRSAAVEADLDLLKEPSGAYHPSRQPGLAQAGLGLQCPAPDKFCVTWSRPTYNNQHTFTGFGQTYAMPLPGVVPTPDTEVRLAVGRFGSDGLPSLMLAYVDDSTGALRVFHIGVQRDPSGAVEGIGQPISQVNLGPVLWDGNQPLGASIAVADFTGSGLDQAAVVWAPDGSQQGARIYSAALLGLDGTGEIKELVAPQTVPLQIEATGDNGKHQTTPGVAVMMQGKSKAHIVVGPGVEGYTGLQTLSITDQGTFEVVAHQRNTVEKIYPSTLESLGDIDADGLDDLASLTDDTIQDTYSPRVEILKMSGPRAVYFGASDSESVAVGSRMTVLDARATDKQVISPVPGKVTVDALPQIAIVGEKRQLFGCLGGRHALMVDFQSLDASGHLWGSTAQPLSGCVLDPETPAVSSFALDGYAEIGNPVRGQYTTLEPSVILNAPPTHFDVLNGKMYDPNFCYAGNQYEVPPVCFFTSEYEGKTNSTLEVTNESHEAWAVSAKVNTSFNLFGMVEVEAEFRGGYGESFDKVNGTTTTDTVEVNVKARNTDKIYAIRRAWDTLEYPVFQPGDASPSFYILTTKPYTVSKRWLDINSPDAINLDVNHEPGNILSYPEDISTAENPFISPTQKDPNDPVVEAFAPQEFELSDFSDFTYSLTTEKVDTAKASRKKEWNAGSTISGGGKIAGVVDLKVEVSGDYNGSSLKTSSTTVGASTKLSAALGGIDESFGETAYTVKPFAYWTDTGALVLDYAVSPGVAPPGAPKTWWQVMYGRNPDITMKLPRLLDYEKQAGISADAARFISTGMRVLRGPCTAARTLAADYPVPGAPLCVRVQVENYSLKDAPAGTTVNFYDADPDVGGRLLGSATVGAVPARGSQVATFDWTPDARYAGSMARIFATVDADNAVTEIHEDNNKGFRAYRAAADPTVAPRAPEDVEVDVSSGRTLDVSWTDPQDGVQPAGHSWRVVAYRDDGLAPLEQVIDGSTLSAQFTDVAPGRYRVAVFSVDAGVTSPASHPAEPADVASETPGTPTNVRGTAGDATVALQWTAPLVTGGVPVDSYRIREHRQPSEDYPQPPIDTIVSGNATGLTLSGLTNGRPYRFTVQALNVAGAGDQSLPSSAVTPLGVPDAVTNVKAERAGLGIAKVMWEPPPLSSGRSEVTGYQVTVSPGGAVSEVPGKNSSADIAGLEAGVRYTFTVRPISATGRGPDSAPSNPLILPGAPSVARSVTAKAGTEPGTAVVTWIQPESSGGVALDRYQVCRVGGACQEEPGSAVRSIVSGLPVGVPLLFTVTARNEAGLESQPQTSTEITLAQAPQITVVQGPAEGSHTLPGVRFEFTSSIPEAALTCFVDGVGSPCSSPVILNGLANGRHTFQAKASAEGGMAQTVLRTWTVDGVAPKAVIDDLPLLARKGIPRLQYSAVDHGSSGLVGYDIRTRTNSLLGTFSEPVVVRDPSPSPQRMRRLQVERGTTVCASVRATDLVGNTSDWSDWKCASRPLDQSGLDSFGYWTPVKSRFFSEGKALRTVSPGSALSVRIGRSEAVSVTAVSCTDCGRLEVRHRGQLLRVINLARDAAGPESSHAGRHAREYTVPWPQSARGELRLVALGGGPVTIDGVTVVRQH